MNHSHFLIPKHSYSDLQHYRQKKGNAVDVARKRRPEEILEELKISGLRGRGGAGFPTASKWKTLYEDKSEKKFVVVNAAEGEPGTFKDRFILRKNPYAIIEGALIAAHVLNTKEIYIAIRKTFVQEIMNLDKAINEFKKQNELNDINIHVALGPEDYLFGEEKALLNVIEGIGALPREAHYPPYEIGLFATPTERNPALVSNVETYARVPDIIINGGESFRALGTEDTPGPILCTLSGDINQPGIYEVEPGLSLAELIEMYGGGMKENKRLKAILSGVASGVLTNEQVNGRIDFKSLASAGGGLGSAGFMIFDESRSIPRLTQEIAKFLSEESCGQCTACKTGLGISSKAIDDLFTDKADKDLLNKIIEGAKSAPQANRCFLPVQGSLLIPSLIQNFPHEFQEILHKVNREIHARKVILPLIVDFIEDQNHFALEGESNQSPLVVNKLEQFDDNILDRSEF